MENKQLEDFRNKVKKMTKEELCGYLSAARGVNRVFSLLGICFIFLMLSYPAIPVLIFGGLVVYIIGKASEGVSTTLVLVKEELLKFQKG